MKRQKMSSSIEHRTYNLPHIQWDASRMYNSIEMQRHLKEKEANEIEMAIN